MVRSFHRCSRGAFTLVEMLIAMVLTLILVTAIAQFYAIVGDSVKDGRAMIEMGSQMRAATQRLKADLDLITVSVVPWTDDGSASGYLTYFEGLGNDYNANGNFSSGASPTPIVDALEDADSNGTLDLQQLGITNLVGDGDDFIAFTIRSSGQPFTGRYTFPILTGSPVIYTSQLAEVAWWVGFDDLDQDNIWDFDEPRQLYRRQLLIRPDLTGIDNNTAYTDPILANRQMLSIWQENDISLSIRTEFNVSGGVVYRIRPNSLADLSKREYRFGHSPAALQVAGTPPTLVDSNFPHRQVLLPAFSAKSPGLATTQVSFALQGRNSSQGESPGEDVVLSNLLAFDVQVYDPYAKLWPEAGGSATTALVPHDRGYSAAADAGTAATLLGLGAYVDLNYYRHLTTNAINKDVLLSNPAGANIPIPYFAFPFAPSGLAALGIIPAAQVNNYQIAVGSTYDTWSLSYERDGIDQFGDNVYDRQTNGLDDNSTNGVDDVGERETVPPYSQPLRGLQVKIRLYEPSTRQVRQATVGTDFITE